MALDASADTVDDGPWATDGDPVGRSADEPDQLRVGGEEA